MKHSHAAMAVMVVVLLLGATRELAAQKTTAPKPTIKSSTVRVTTPTSRYPQVGGPPAKPSDVKVLMSGSIRSGDGYDFVALMWTDHAVNETGFVIERKTANGYQVIGNTAANETFFEDVGVDPQGWNQWRVKACNPRGCSEYAEFAQGGGAAQLKPNQKPSNQDTRGDGGGGGGGAGTGGASAADKCRAEGGVWIGLGMNHCSKVLGAVNNAVQAVTSPTYQAYLVYFGVVGGGATMRPLPEDVIQALKPFYGEALLREVRYGSSNHTVSENTAMTDCKNIYFPSGTGHVVVIKNGQLLAKNAQGALVNEGTMRLLLHELQHSKQCADISGRANYAARWFSELGATLIVKIITAPTTVSSKTLHDAMPMEDDADSKEGLASQI